MLYGELCITAYTKVQRLRWLNHMEKINKEEEENQLKEKKRKTEGKRRDNRGPENNGNKRLM